MKCYGERLSQSHDSHMMRAAEYKVMNKQNTIIITNKLLLFMWHDVIPRQRAH